MSRRVDTERREASIEARTESAKDRLRLAQSVLTAYVEGLGIAATAQRVGRSRAVVWRVRVWLGVQRAGRRQTRGSIEEVRP